MYIDSLTVTAFVVFVVAMGMFVKKCLINSCILDADKKTGSNRDVKAGNER